MLSQKKREIFVNHVWNFYHINKRNLPWRYTKDPYWVLVSEVMLQQTQVTTVLKRYRTFIQRFPTISSLANAPLSEVLASWQGMGYNRRALYLKQIAQEIIKRYKGTIPSSPLLLKELPGIGHTTACSIVVFSYNLSYSFIETNIRRVFIYHFFEAPKEPMSSRANVRLRGRRPRDELERRRIHDKELLPLVEETMDRKNPREWFYALMDYGAHLGKTIENPNKKSAHYHKQSTFEGSNRQLRGKILKLFLSRTTLSIEDIKCMLDTEEQILQSCLTDLQKEGFIQQRKGFFRLSTDNAKV